MEGSDRQLPSGHWLSIARHGDSEQDQWWDAENCTTKDPEQYKFVGSFRQLRILLLLGRYGIPDTSRTHLPTMTWDCSQYRHHTTSQEYSNKK
jgi:hypothetical protein